MTQWTLLTAFMDEEVSPVLRDLLARGRSVLVVERGAITEVPSRIFEQPTGSFPVRPSVVATTALPTGYRPPKPGQATTLAAQQQALAWQLKTLLSAPQAAGEDLPPDFVRKLNDRSFFAVTDGETVIGRREKLIRTDRSQPPALSVFAFGAPDSRGTPVILVRAPEMGMQPSLMRPYLRLIAKAITILLGDGDQVCLRAFGASGAIGGTKPGDITTMSGSLYVGAERDVLAGSDTVRSIVALCSADTLTYFHDEKIQPTSAADLKRAWDEAEAKARDYLAKPDPKLKQAVDALRSSGKQVSLTLSFFGGQEVKHAAALLGLFSTNTEDYHLFRLGRSMKWPKLGQWAYPHLADLTVQRVDVDPPKIPGPVVQAYARWTASARLAMQDYRQLLVWGLAGCPLGDAVPQAAWWRFAQDSVFQGQEARECFGRYAVSGDIRPLDPTAVEIAVDMLRDLSEDKKAPFGAEVKATAGRVLTADTPGLSRAIDAFIAAWQQVPEVRDGRVWVRTGKWAGNTGCWLHTLAASESNVDRSFYRSANLLALAESATTFVGPLKKAAG